MKFGFSKLSNSRIMLFFLTVISYTSVNSATTIYLTGDIEHHLYGLYINNWPNPSNNIDDINSTFTAQRNGVLSRSPDTGEYVPSERITIKSYLNEPMFASGIQDWYFEFTSPQNTMFDISLYKEIYRSGFNTGNQAGMSISLAASGCNQVGGWINVQDVNIVNNTISSLALDFAHTCFTPTTDLISEGYIDENGMYIDPVYRDSYMHGSIRINSDIPVNAVPIPAAFWLLCSGLAFLVLSSQRKINTSSLISNITST